MDPCRARIGLPGGRFEPVNSFSPSIDDSCASSYADHGNILNISPPLICSDSHLGRRASGTAYMTHAKAADTHREHRTHDTLSTLIRIPERPICQALEMFVALRTRPVNAV